MLQISPRQAGKTEKPWGHEQLITCNEHYAVKRIFMKAGHRCSLQYHKQKLETIVGLFGIIDVQIGQKDPQIIPIDDGGAITIPPGTIHRMSAKEDAYYLECSTNNLDDLVRISDDYGR